MEFEPRTSFQRFRNLSYPVKFGLVMGIYSAIVAAVMSVDTEAWVLKLPVFYTTLLVVFVVGVLFKVKILTVLGLLILLGVQAIFHFSLAYAIARLSRKVIGVVAKWCLVQAIAFFFFGYLVAGTWNL